MLTKDCAFEMFLATCTQVTDSQVQQSMPVDFNAVKENAQAQGVSLSEIAIFYENLTSQERHALGEWGLIAADNGGTVVARFANDGSVMFAEKAVGVYCLSA